MYDLFSYSLLATPTPAAVTLLGCSADGRRAVIAYFIMGRSENSRNRVLKSPRTASVPRRLTSPE